MIIYYVVQWCSGNIASGWYVLLSRVDPGYKYYRIDEMQILYSTEHRSIRISFQIARLLVFLSIHGENTKRFLSDMMWVKVLMFRWFLPSPERIFFWFKINYLQSIDDYLVYSLSANVWECGMLYILSVDNLARLMNR